MSPRDKYHPLHWLAVGLPVNPEISRTILRYDLCPMRDSEGGPYRWYAGAIRPGMVFAWEPELPHARELCVVTRLDQADELIIHTRSLDGPPIAVSPIRYREVWNEESRFREAVVPTTMKAC